MWIEGIGNIENISTAVFYCRKDESTPFKFFPSYLSESSANELVSAALIGELTKVSDNYKASKFVYRGSSKNPMIRDFIEYGTSFDILKEKFNNAFLISELDKDSQDLIGKDSLSLSTMDGCLFPTYGDGDAGGDNYFGVVNISGKLVHIFDTPDLCFDIELYNESGINDIEYSYNYTKYVLKSEPKYTPAVILHLGPSPELVNNLKALYFKNDPMVSDYGKNPKSELEYSYNRRKEKELIKDKLKYSKLLDELESCDVVALSLSTDNNSTVNLSYNAWLSNDNPNRNQNKYTLRNDEYFSTIRNLDSTFYSSDLSLIDRKSGTIVGNKSIKKSPILSRKIRKIESAKKEIDGIFYDMYSPFVTYSKKDKVYYDGEIWESISNGNIENFPSISNSWILKKMLNYGLNDRITVITKVWDSTSCCWTNTTKCSTSTRGEITISDPDEEIQFQIICEPGYNIYKDSNYDDIYSKSIVYLDSNGNEREFDFGEITYNERGTVTLRGLKKVINSDNKTIIVKFESTTISAKMTANLGEGVIPYKNWEEAFETYFDYSIKVGNLSIDGLGEIRGLIANRTYLFRFNDNPKYYIKDVKASYYDYATLTKIYDSSNIVIDKNGLSFTDTLNYSTDVNYELQMGISSRSITVLDAKEFEVSEYFTTVPYGTTKEISWYPMDEEDREFHHFKINVGGLEKEITHAQTFSGVEIIYEPSGITTILVDCITDDIIISEFK